MDAVPPESAAAAGERAAAPPRDIELAEVFNLRDLGGYSTADGRRVRWRRLYRGVGLQRLAGVDLEVVRSLGWVSVVDLRTDAEVDATGVCPAPAARRPALRLPLIRRVWPRELLSPDQSAEEFLLDRYRDMLDEGAATIRAAVELLGRAENLPGAFYCAAGKDRTGVLAAVVLGALGVDDETIAQDYHLSRDRVDRIRARAQARRESTTMVTQPEAFMQAPAEAMRLLLDWVARTHGGAAGYLRSIGVPAQRIDGLRGALLEPAPA